MANKVIIRKATNGANIGGGYVVEIISGGKRETIAETAAAAGDKKERNGKAFNLIRAAVIAAAIAKDRGYNTTDFITRTAAAATVKAAIAATDKAEAARQAAAAKVRNLPTMRTAAAVFGKVTDTEYTEAEKTANAEYTAAAEKRRTAAAAERELCRKIADCKMPIWGE